MTKSQRKIMTICMGALLVLLVLLREDDGALCLAAEASLRVGGVEETDSVFKPVLGMSVENKSFGLQMYVWGTFSGVIKNRSVVMAAYAHHEPFKHFPVVARVGGSVVYEDISLNYDTDQSIEIDLSAGLLLGLDVPLYHSSQWSVDLFWDSVLIYLGQGLIALGIIDRKAMLGISLTYKY